jgi:VWFA-related protein
MKANTLMLMGIFLLIMCLLSFNTGAQELQHEVTVTLKLIQVYVTDNKGDPVTDLKPDEFIVYDNKKLQKITDFERFILFPSGDSTESQPETKDVEPSSSPDKVMSRKFFLFFDLANNNFKGFIKSQEAALYFIDNQLQPSDEVGVLSFSVLRGLTLHEYFTKDRQAIRTVVKQMGDEGRVGRADNFEALVWRDISGESALDASQAAQPVKEGIPAHLKSIPRAFGDASQDWRRSQNKSIAINLLEKLTDLSKSLRYISGHKHIILFSSGIPYSLIHGFAGTSMGGRGGLDTFLKDKYEETLKELSNANTTVFSLNTEALATNMNLPYRFKGEATLRSLSKYTGGKFLGNVQNYAEILDTVQTFTGSYYVLGFYVNETWDGRYQSIKVNVTRPKCKVFAQKGYFNPKHFSKYTKTEKELHLIDLALSENPLLQAPIHLPMTALPCPIKGDPAVLLMAQVPENKIGESMGERAEIYFMVFDEKENILDLKMKKMKISALKGKEGYYYSLMPISPGKYKFHIVIRDMDSGKGAVGRYAMEIPEAPKQGLQVLPPLLLAPGKSGLFLRGYVPKTLDSKFPLLDYFPFDPTSYSPLLGEIPHNTKKLLAVLRCSMWNLSKPLLKFSAALIEQSSERSFSLPISILSGKKEGNLGILLVEFQIPEMEPGDYILEISAVDKASQARSQTSITCRIQ